MELPQVELYSQVKVAVCCPHSGLGLAESADIYLQRFCQLDDSIKNTKNVQNQQCQKQKNTGSVHVLFTVCYCCS